MPLLSSSISEKNNVVAQFIVRIVNRFNTLEPSDYLTGYFFFSTLLRKSGINFAAVYILDCVAVLVNIASKYKTVIDYSKKTN